MSDIVERLRQGIGIGPDEHADAERAMDDAADEIERLHARNAALVAGRPSPADERDAEIERLRAELARIRGLPRLAALDDEIKRLRAENKRLRTALDVSADYGDKQVTEIGRLLAALHRIADDAIVDRLPKDIARAAIADNAAGGAPRS
jgi:uncharacterized small protein (DUF1192 family)